MPRVKQQKRRESSLRRGIDAESPTAASDDPFAFCSDSESDHEPALVATSPSRKRTHIRKEPERHAAHKRVDVYYGSSADLTSAADSDRQATAKRKQRPTSAAPETIQEGHKHGTARSGRSTAEHTSKTQVATGAECSQAEAQVSPRTRETRLNVRKRGNAAKSSTRAQVPEEELEQFFRGASSTYGRSTVPAAATAEAAVVRVASRAQRDSSESPSMRLSPESIPQCSRTASTRTLPPALNTFTGPESQRALTAASSSDDESDVHDEKAHSEASALPAALGRCSTAETLTGPDQVADTAGKVSPAPALRVATGLVTSSGPSRAAGSALHGSAALSQPGPADAATETTAMRPRLHRDKRHIQLDPAATVTESCHSGQETAGWRRGQLLRLRLHHFLAFDEMEIRPGRTLNLVVGPNGSGKSSIVAGICIGLGGKLELLSRAPVLSSYIKHGCERARIDVELFDPDASGTRRRISRSFSRDGRGGFTLDGESVSKRTIEELCAHYDIQLDNICTFLPQERVPELVECTPTELLRQTIRAVFGSAALEAFEALAEQQANDAAWASRLAAHEARLADWIRQNEALEAQLRFYEERQALLQEIEQMRLYRPYCIYEICRQEAIAARDAFKTVDRVYRAKCADWERLCAPLRAMQQEWLQLQHERDAQKQVLSDLTVAARQQQADMNEALARFDEANDALARLAQDLAERKRNYEGCQHKVERLETELAALMQRTGTEAELEKRIEEKRRERQQIAERLLSVSDAMRNLEQQHLAPLQSQFQELQNQRDRLRNIRQQRLALIQRRNPHSQVIECYQFITAQREAGRFRGQVWGPLPLEVRTSDAFYSDVLETVLGGWLEVVFVFEHPEDERIVFQESQRNHWRVNTIALVRPDVSLAPPAPVASVEPLGVRAFLSDCFEAPENLKKALADAVPIHLIAVADAEAGRHVRELALKHRVYAVFTPQNGYRSRLSRYNAESVSIRVEALQRRRAGLYAMPDERQVAQLDDQLAQLDAQRAHWRAQAAALAEQEKALRIQERSLQQELASLLEDRKQLRHAQQRLTMQRSLMETIARDLQNTAKDDEKRKRWQRAASEAAHRYAQLVIAGAEQLAQQQAAIAAMVERTWLMLDKQRLLSAGERSLATAALEMQTLLQQRDDARQRVDEAKSRMRQKRQEAEAVAPLTAALQQQLRAWQFPTSVEELDERIARAQARADALTSVSAEVVQVYERRQQQIEALRQQLERERAQHATALRELHQESQRWLRDLRTLVRSISLAFSRLLQQLHCAGQVDLLEDEELRRLALRIQVQFRANEPLRTLSAQHHSGGEKMVATMLFLLAMQRHARPPIRVIDEINQGMDPHNERAIIQMMMEEAQVSDDASSQFPQTLLVSPKLLLDLKYNQQLVMHCVWNGPHMRLQADGDSSESTSA